MNKFTAVSSKVHSASKSQINILAELINCDEITHL